MVYLRKVEDRFGREEGVKFPQVARDNLQLCVERPCVALPISPLGHPCGSELKRV